MPDSAELRDDSRRSSLPLILLSSLVPTAIIVTIVYLVWVYQPAQATQSLNEQTTANTLGLSRPVQNKLAAAYTDADGDLVADPPSESAQLLDPPTLRFSFIAMDDPAPAKEAWADFVAHLSSQLGRPVEHVSHEDVTDQLKALRDGHLHITVLNTGSVPIGVCGAGFVPVAMVSNEQGGMLQSVLIVPATSDIKAPRDLRSRQLTLTDPGSNSGFKAVVVALDRDFQMRPERDYQVVYSYSHDASIAGIARGKYSAAAVASDLLARAEALGVIKPDQYRVIYRSENFPSATIGYSHALKPDLARKIRSAIESFKWQNSSLEKMYAGKNDRFLKVDYKTAWAPIRNIDNAIGFSYELK